MAYLPEAIALYIILCVLAIVRVLFMKGGER